MVTFPDAGPPPPDAADLCDPRNRPCLAFMRCHALTGSVLTLSFPGAAAWDAVKDSEPTEDVVELLPSLRRRSKKHAAVVQVAKGSVSNSRSRPAHLPSESPLGDSGDGVEQGETTGVRTDVDVVGDDYGDESGGGGADGGAGTGGGRNQIAIKFGGG